MALLRPYSDRVATELRTFLPREGAYALYGMMRYFMGFADEKLAPANIYGGKRFRSALCLLVADLYGHMEEAMRVAVSLELFHNFTLIHDDIVDNDALRRGRPTVWKLWGVPHAINTGDGQLLLAFRALSEVVAGPLKNGSQIHALLVEKYLEVIEGQYLDFLLTDMTLEDSAVTRAHYFTMITKKTSVLVGAAAQSGGMVAGLPHEECERLYAYGEALGMAVQLHDDQMSIWGDSERTGKDVGGDIRERKKTFPIIFARDTLSQVDSKRLCDLYAGTAPLTDGEVAEIVALLDSVHARTECEEQVKKYVLVAEEMCAQLTCPVESREILKNLQVECLTR